MTKVLIKLSILSAMFILLMNHFLKKQERVFYQTECKIFDSQGHLVRIFDRSDFCLLLDDGSIISATTRHLKKINPNGEIQWFLKNSGYYHHALTLLKNKSEFLIFSSNYRDENNKDYRYTQLQRYSLDGKLLQQWQLSQHFDTFFKLIKKTPERSAVSVDMHDYSPFKYEFEHINSIQEIPANVAQTIRPSLAQGNLLIGINPYCVVAIFDKTSFNLIDTISIFEGENCYFHDPQILPSGELLVYINKSLKRHKERANVFIEKINLVNGAHRSIFPQINYSSTLFGGVQEIEKGQYLINGFVTKERQSAVVINDEGRVVKEFDNSANGPDTIGVGQVLKRVNLESFFNNLRY